MMDYWRTLPLSDYYPYPLRPSPHPFMGLGKFMAGRIYQIHSQKCYLAALPSCFNADDSPLYPLSRDDPETLSHAILRCPPRPQLELATAKASSQYTMMPLSGFLRLFFSRWQPSSWPLAPPFHRTCFPPLLSPLFRWFSLPRPLALLLWTCLPLLPPAPFSFSSATAVGFISSYDQENFQLLLSIYFPLLMVCLVKCPVFDTLGDER